MPNQNKNPRIRGVFQNILGFFLINNEFILYFIIHLVYYLKAGDINTVYILNFFTTSLFSYAQPKSIHLNYLHFYVFLHKKKTLTKTQIDFTPLEVKLFHQKVKVML